MKNVYLILSILIASSAIAQTFDGIPTGTGYYINKSIPSPSGDDLTNEYFEIRGTANEIVPNDLYLIAIECDGESGSLGKVVEAIKLGDGTRTFGSNGILAIVANYTNENTSVTTTNGYTALIDSEATILTIALTGNDVNSSSSSAVSTKTPDIGYDGNLSDGSATYMLVRSASTPKSKYIDGLNSGQGLAADGVIDSSGDHTSWTLYDSYSFIDDDGNEYGYGQIIFVEDSAIAGSIKTTTSATVVIYDTTSEPTMVLRQGTNTGYTIESDWVAACKGSGGGPQWEFSNTSHKTKPAAFLGWKDLYQYYGKLNPTAATLSVDSFDVKDVNFYPNPTNGKVYVQNFTGLQSVAVFNMIGEKIFGTKEITNSLDFSALNNGIYLIEFQFEDAKVAKKLIIK